MTPWLDDQDAKLYHGDALTVLRELPSDFVNCVVTSPPYFGLRDYGTAEWSGGDSGCDHIQPVSYKRSTLGASTGGRSEETHARSVGAQATPYRYVCGKCGATRIDEQLGLEPDRDEYILRMTEVFWEIKRVLVEDGTAWLNMGDSFKDKQLIGTPWRLAFALQDDGWLLRSDVIWAKPNPMPESISDRPTKSHEYIFLLSKNSRYYFNAEAVREKAEWARWGDQTVPKYKGTSTATGWMTNGTKEELQARAETGRNIRSVWTIATQSYPEAHFAVFPEELARLCISAGCPEDGIVMDPFVGSGTVPYVARKLGRRSMGIDLSESYLQLAAQRLQQQSLFAQEASGV